MTTATAVYGNTAGGGINRGGHFTVTDSAANQNVGLQVDASSSPINYAILPILVTGC